MSFPLGATIHERGNGFPEVGEFVAADDGGLYRIVSFSGPIHTGQAGQSNYLHAEVEAADWGDCPEGEESTCLAIVGDDAEEREERWWG